MKVPKQNVIAAMEEITWPYASNDQANALQDLQDRICKTGRLGVSLISYSNLVSGISFRFSNVRDGEPFVIDVQNWDGLERRIIGDCLGYISYVSYRDHDFMASALVAGLAWNKPSELFFEWMESIGAIPNMDEDTIDSFWIDQVNKAQAWYKSNPKGFKVN